jgi:glutamine synthetase
MAKPRQGLPGNSGHIHISLVDEATGENLFAREEPDPAARWPDEKHLTTLGRRFLAGILWGIPDVMPMLAPTVNSYKRLVENYWAPVTASWGFEHRSAAVRVICPPSAAPGATRIEARVPGADANPHLALAALLALGWRGVKRELDFPMPPLARAEGMGGAGDDGFRLARSLREATAAFMKPGSVARECFGDEFVDHFGGTRLHECQLWDEAVTDW